GPGLRARRRLRADRLHRHCDRGRGRRLRLLGGAAGIIPSVISPMVLARIGPAAGRRYFLTGERFDARTALRIGLVHEVAADLDGAVERVVADLLAGGPVAVREAKRLVLDPGDEDALVARAAERRTSEEGQEGLRAFLEKRAPGW